MAEKLPDEALHAALEESRALTLALVALADDREWSTALDPEFSPVGWHLGHIAVFEAFWVLERAHGQPPIRPDFSRIFDPRQTPKRARQGLPDRPDVLAFADEVRGRVLARLAVDLVSQPDAALRRGLFAYRFALAHEQQHAETLATILRMRSRERREASGWPLPIDAPLPPRPESLRFQGGIVRVGEDDALVGYDNERPAHDVVLAPFELDARPASHRDWLTFVGEHGYARRELWSPEGWAWRERAQIHAPSTWRRTSDGWCLGALGGDVALPLAHPVEGLSAHEADAYARFVGARLPTEAEWECVVRLHTDGAPHFGLRAGATRALDSGPDLLGNVWEWTSTWFAPYPGFQPFPYDGYSSPWFDGRHRVLRGGSWASQSCNVRPSFRNWFEPHCRAFPFGVRCARDA